MPNINVNNLRFLNSTIKDLAEILVIEKLCFKIPWSYESYFTSLENNNNILKHILYENKILGFILAELIFNELNILKIAVLENYRKQGLGIYLLKNLIKNINEKIDKIFLEVSVNNTEAISFYNKLGFNTVDIRKKYYSNGDDAKIMLCTYNDFIKKVNL